jgi:hypothetical protein
LAIKLTMHVVFVFFRSCMAVGFRLFVCLALLMHHITIASFDFDSMLSCFRREYNFRATKNFVTPHGLVLPCSDVLTVYSCYGRCDSSEVIL